ncbi:tyrosine-type recombinase/integrase [Burkholderia sp. Ac-20353]|uniref:site-specific integrase n=1 Tax=Burkholderia sp. Ac-20353 TaxID=2703894 RepID=UPI00197B35F1|nr:tyrosine-type recombinase/integrase [Burkholderia sp. Ac-20353]MBN3790442.1 tyrosine-type recombinase/integrase [Burkholderia sp. Ac-20353]
MSGPVEVDTAADRDKEAAQYLANTAIDLLRAAVSRAPHAAMLDLLQVDALPDAERLSDVLKFYLRANPNRYNRRFRYHAKRAFDYLIAVVGDLPVSRVKRSDARTFVEQLVKAGLRTSSIRRVLNQIAAAMSLYFTEHEVDRANPFHRVRIPNEDEDTEQREPFTPSELRKLLHLCHAADDDIRWIVAMLADTGARLAEVAGLTLDDIALDADVPHISIRHRPWRSVKNATRGSSERDVPLTGFALWAAKRIKGSAKQGQRYAFPRYTSILGCNANSASAAIGKWMRANGINHTAHELRHTMADRLREVRCPDEIRKAIGGWSIGGEAAKYGKGHPLRIKWEWLEKAARSCAKRPGLASLDTASDA